MHRDIVHNKPLWSPYDEEHVRKTAEFMLNNLEYNPGGLIRKNLTYEEALLLKKHIMDQRASLLRHFRDHLSKDYEPKKLTMSGMMFSADPRNYAVALIKKEDVNYLLSKSIID